MTPILVCAATAYHIGYAVPMLIGTVAAALTASTTFEPAYMIARRFASLDHISGGRAGWNLVTTSNPDAALNFGLTEHMGHGERSPPQFRRWSRRHRTTRSIPTPLPIIARPVLAAAGYRRRHAEIGKAGGHRGQIRRHHRAAHA